MTDVPASWLLFAQDAPAAAAEATSTGMPWWGKILVAIALMVLPFVLGTLIARALKLKDLGGKIGLVLFTLVLGLTPFVRQQVAGNHWTDAIKRGIDLGGGTNLVYEIDAAKAAEDGKDITPELVDRMVRAIARRLDPAGQDQITVRRVGADRIEVIIPGADPDVVASKKKKIYRLGNLEFAILANSLRHQNLIDIARQSDARDVRVQGRIRASWRPVGTKQDGTAKEVSSDDYDRRSQVATREVEVDVDGKPIKEYLVVFDEPEKRVTGKYLSRSYATTDSESGSPAVGFDFNTKGGFLFQSLTGRYQPEQDFTHRLAVLLDDKVHSAPGVEAIISDSGIIRGSFTKPEIDELVAVLNAGALDAPINPNPISEFSISPMLGKDVQEKGKWAILIAGVAVVVFMLIYYMKAGLIANLCLILNIVLVMGTMALIDAVFTLPGLAGIVLTIGMAVDANVLIFERMREETSRGSSLKNSIKNGFGKAFSTIVDANVTTLLTAVVLYLIGTEQVRGFAVTLFIGIVMSMYTTLFFGRLLFDILERKHWLKKLTMLSVVGKTHWNFLKGRMVATVVSLVFIAAGVAALFARGEDNLDIDFTGGSMVTMQFVEPQNIDEVRGILQQTPLGSSITLEELDLAGLPDAESVTGKLFRLRTKEQDISTVRQEVNTALSESDHELRRISMDYDPAQVEPIPVAAANDSAAKKESDESSPTEGEKADSPAEKPAPTETVAQADAPGTVPADDEFAGGRQIVLDFSDTLSTNTVQDYLAEDLTRLQNTDGDSKYELAESLVRVTGTAGPGLTAPEGQVRRYTQARVQFSPVVEEADVTTALAAVQQSMNDNPIFEEINTFAASVASEMQESAFLAMFFSLVAIVAYIWFRFQRITFGFAAVVALVHDVLIVVGMVALASLLSGTPLSSALLLQDFKINLPMIAAFLTIVGYSLNDTIVVFDRIREVRGKNPALTDEIVNASLNQTLSRTILTSLTTFLVVTVLYIGGGEGIHGFAFCLVLGVIVGTYSSIYVASPVLLWLMNRPGSEIGKATATTRKQKTAGVP